MGDTLTQKSREVRIFRVVEGTGDLQTTAEFTVPVAFLTASEVLDPMTNNDGRLTSEDNVIPFDDSLKSVEALVNWMTRKQGFDADYGGSLTCKIHDQWSKHAGFGDSGRQIHHRCTLEGFEPFYYTERYISRKETPTFDLWMFAARYSMHAMEAYCRSDDSVFTEIRSVIADPTKGIEYFMRDAEIPLSVMNKVVTGMASQNSTTSGTGKYCNSCYRSTVSRCTGCGHIY